MSRIEWTGETWNPFRARNFATGGVGHFCVHASPGCKPCYAEAWQPRRGNPIHFIAQDRSKVELFLDDEILRAPLAWKRPRKIFPCSMTDAWLDDYPDKWIDRLFAVAALTPRHTYQFLTKRAERLYKYMVHWPDGSARRHHVYVEILRLLGERELDVEREAVRDRAAQALEVWPLPNVWLGVSAEDQRRWDERLEWLGKTPTAVRWVSAEPLMGMIDVGNAFDDFGERPKDPVEAAKHYEPVDWVVIGGVSGPKAWSTEIEWIDHLAVQCQLSGVPYFVKQLGRLPTFKGQPYKISDPKGGKLEEFPLHLRVRDFPEQDQELLELPR